MLQELFRSSRLQIPPTTQEPPITDIAPTLDSNNPAHVELKSYLLQHCTHLESDEINKILEIAHALETHAVNEFKSKTIQENNQRAKSRLATDSFGAKPTAIASARSFTRAEISAMNPQEFRANRAEIYAQCAKGLVK